jgi:hypothetical protein
MLAAVCQRLYGMNKKNEAFRLLKLMNFPRVLSRGNWRK